MKTRNKDKKK